MYSSFVLKTSMFDYVPVKNHIDIKLQHFV